MIPLKQEPVIQTTLLPFVCKIAAFESFNLTESPIASYNMSVFSFVH